MYEKHENQWAIIAQSITNNTAVLVAASPEVQDAFELLQLTPNDVWDLPTDSTSMVGMTPTFILWSGDLVWHNCQPYLDGSRAPGDDCRFTDLHPIWVDAAGPVHILTPTGVNIHLTTGYGKNRM